MGKDPSQSLGELRNFINWIQGSVRIDSYVSTLHHTCTTVLLLACCFIVSYQQYFGVPIQCLQETEHPTIPEDVMNTYCFISTTYTVASNQVSDMLQTLHPGVGTEGTFSDRKYHAYYQWVPLFLLLQAVIFVLPHTMWRIWEGGFISGVIKNVNVLQREDKIKLMAKYLTARVNMHTSWAVGFYVNEVSNLVNVVLNITFTDLLLGGYFSVYGLQVIQYLTPQDTPSQISPIDVAFPKLTKCLFYKYGPSGTIESRDAMCVMTLNIVNEKMFILLWVWFLLLGIVTFLSVIWHLLITAIIIHKHTTVFFINIFLGFPTLLSREQFSSLKINFVLSDWLVLAQLGKNLSALHFKQLIEQLTQQFDYINNESLLKSSNNV